mmetsp:Transcript_6335/g.14599  ORF Transcript_6335/g.14599 Transcript_6335/m.14599 type:complete len:571 (+) Transcript_6335:24-1736(+)
MPVWLHPGHGPDISQRFLPHRLAANKTASRGENLASCLKNLTSHHVTLQDLNHSIVVKFVQGEVVTQCSPSGVEFNLPLLYADAVWTTIPRPEADCSSNMQTPFDRLETEEIPEPKYLVGVAPRRRTLPMGSPMAALDSFDHPDTDEVWVFCASFLPGTPEMASFLQVMQNSGVLRWDIEDEYVFHKQVIGRGRSSVTRRGMLRKSFLQLSSLLEEHSQSEEEPSSEPSRPVAIKIMKHPETDEEAHSIMAEVRFLAESAYHPNIVALQGTFCVKWRGKSLWLLALELCTGLCLLQHVRLYGPLDRVPGEGAAVALLSAVAHLHSRRLLHRDLRPANILFTDTLRPVLVNFGDAARFGDVSPAVRAKIDGFTAPEVADARLGTPGPASDVFSVAASILFLLTGIEPFSDLTAVSTQTLTGNSSYDEMAVSRMSPNTVTILQRLLARNARKRPSAAKACMMLHEEASEEVQELAVCEQAIAALSLGTGGQSGLEAISESFEGFESGIQAELTTDGPNSGYSETPGPPSGYRPPEPGGAAAPLPTEGFVPTPPGEPSPRKKHLFSRRPSGKG